MGAAAVHPKPDSAPATSIPAAELHSSSREKVSQRSAFIGSGEVSILCELGQQTKSIDLTWASQEGASLSFPSDGATWEGTFGGGTYELEGGKTAHGSLVPLEAVTISSQAPTARIVLRCESAYVVDVKAESGEGEKRLERATIQLDPLSTSDEHGTPSVVVVSKGRDLEPTAVVRLGVGTGWSLVDATPPVVLPGRPASGTVLVSASDHSETLVSGIDAPGLFTATLAPIRTLIVRLLNSSRSEGRYRLEVAFPTGQQLAFGPIRPPDDIPIDMKSHTRADIRVSRELRIGRGRILLQQSFEFNEYAAPDIVELDLANALESSPEGGIRIAVKLASDIGDFLGKLRVELRPVPVTMDFGSLDEPSYHVGRWGRDEAGAYVQAFDGIRPGAYRLLVQPLAIEQQVQIEAEVVCSAEVLIPELSEVRVWPIGAGGSPVADPHKLGSLAWSYVGRAEEAASEANEASKYNVSPDSAFALNFSLGKANLAQCIDGGWLIVAHPERRIAIHFVGPTVLRAEPLEVELRSGSMDETLRFSGL